MIRSAAASTCDARYTVLSLRNCECDVAVERVRYSYYRVLVGRGGGGGGRQRNWVHWVQALVYQLHESFTWFVATATISNNYQWNTTVNKNCLKNEMNTWWHHQRLSQFLPLASWAVWRVHLSVLRTVRISPERSPWFRISSRSYC